MCTEASCRCALNNVVSLAQQLRLRTVLMIFYTLCLVLLWFVAPDNCASAVFTWMGIMPMQVSLFIFHNHDQAAHVVLTPCWRTKSYLLL